MKFFNIVLISLFTSFVAYSAPNLTDPFSNDECEDDFSSISIIQHFDGAECPGDIFTFSASVSGSSSGSYSWIVYNGASIISGQGTSQVRVQSPASSGFRIDVSKGSLSDIDLCEYGNCGGGSGGPGGTGGGSTGGGTPTPSGCCD